MTAPLPFSRQAERKRLLAIYLASTRQRLIRLLTLSLWSVATSNIQRLGMPNARRPSLHSAPPAAHRT